MSIFGDWDFKGGHVQDIGLERGEDFVSSESIVICAALPRENDSLPIGLSDLVPIGVLDNATVAQNKQIQQIFEIGSRIPYFISGRTYIQVQLSRVFFNGNSLLAALYPKSAYFPRAIPVDKPGSETTYNGTTTQFYTNLASSFFNKPTDLALIAHDSEDEPVGGMLLKTAYVQNYQMSITGQQTIVLENVTLRVSNIEGLDIIS